VLGKLIRRALLFQFMHAICPALIRASDNKSTLKEKLFASALQDVV
jgi:hypothetical protein